MIESDDEHMRWKINKQSFLVCRLQTLKGVCIFLVSNSQSFAWVQSWSYISAVVSHTSYLYSTGRGNEASLHTKVLKPENLGLSPRTLCKPPVQICTVVNSGLNHGPKLLTLIALMVTAQRTMQTVRVLRTNPHPPWINPTRLVHCHGIYTKVDIYMYMPTYKWQAKYYSLKSEICPLEYVKRFFTFSAVHPTCSLRHNSLTHTWVTQIDITAKYRKEMSRKIA